MLRGRRVHCRGTDTAVPANLALLVLDVLLRPLAGDRVFVAIDEQRGLVMEVPVEILERAARGLGVEEVDDGHESAVEDGPDDVELPA